MPVEMPDISLISDSESIFAPVQRAQAYKQQQNALARQQAIRNALAANIDPATGQTNWQNAYAMGGQDVAPDLQQMQQADMMSQAELFQKRSQGQKTSIDAETAYWSQQRDTAARIGDQSSWSTWRSTLPSEFQQFVPEQYSDDNKRKTLATADKALALHFQQVDTGGGGYTLQMPETGGGPATVVPGSRYTKTMSPAEKARLDAETQTGAFSEDSIDLMAGLVAQGYQLPIALGRGSKSDALKNTIMERAGRIAQGLSPRPTAPAPAGTRPGAVPAAPAVPAASAADVAATIGGARQDQSAIQSAIRYYTSGMGNRQITSLNTAVDHLDTLSELSAALGNNDVKLINRAAQAWKEQTGQEAPVKFDAAKQIVAAEVIKAIVANGGGVTERQEAAEKISRANSPAQLNGVIEGFQELLAGQLESIGTQYKATTRRNDFDARLGERTKRVLGRNKNAGDVAEVKTDADYEKLPSGTLFVGPDGKQRRKP